jgi:hypothetical protein
MSAATSVQENISQGLAFILENREKFYPLLDVPDRETPVRNWRLGVRRPV